MVAILTTKKTKHSSEAQKGLVSSLNQSSYAALVRRNFAADLFAEKYDNRSQSKAIEFNRKQSKGNRTQSNAIKFSKVFLIRLAFD